MDRRQFELLDNSMWTHTPEVRATWEAYVAEHDLLRKRLEDWSGDGAEYRHALDHVVDCEDGCEQCRRLAQSTLDLTTMGKAT